MQQTFLRTYKRRSVTRESGYHTCSDTTGGECIILKAQKYKFQRKEEKFTFQRDTIELVNLFKKNLALLCFGGYIYINQKVNISYNVEFEYDGKKYVSCIKNKTVLKEKDWNSIGFHIEISTGTNMFLKNIKVEMIINSVENLEIEFISFDFDSLTKKEFLEDRFEESFFKKTNMCIPFLYYLKTELPICKYLVSNQQFKPGQSVILKSCNRCGRYMPINIFNEISTLSFSLHCKKLAPCPHSTFRNYSIQNEYDYSDLLKNGVKIEDSKIISYYGHQLECKACKKFFVNMPLNPQRNAQQFKEDGLRRRAIEVLINCLLDKNLVHFEFKKRNKKEFAEYIWRKFNCCCFKCKKKLDISEMNLDHTMPLAYLYRLDETATCLCDSHNSQKSDHFPVDYYSEDELIELSKITGLNLETLHSKEINKTVLDLLVKNVVWFYDEFLMRPEYQKIRDGILTANKINDSLKRVINGKVDLVEEYKKITGYYPRSITII